MKKYFDAWKKLTIWHKGVCIFLFLGILRGWQLDKLEMVLIYGFVLLVYWTRETIDPAECKKLVQAKFRSGFSDALDPGNPCGFNNPASPLYHMHNDKSMFDR